MHILTSEQTYLPTSSQQEQTTPAWLTDWQKSIWSRSAIKFADTLANLYRDVMEKK